MQFLGLELVFALEGIREGGFDAFRAGAEEKGHFFGLGYPVVSSGGSELFGLVSDSDLHLREDNGNF